jgi:hypothetical protein
VKNGYFCDNCRRNQAQFANIPCKGLSPLVRDLNMLMT